MEPKWAKYSACPPVKHVCESYPGSSSGRQKLEDGDCEESVLDCSLIVFKDEQGQIDGGAWFRA